MGLWLEIGSKSWLSVTISHLCILKCDLQGSRVIHIHPPYHAVFICGKGSCTRPVGVSLTATRRWEVHQQYKNVDSQPKVPEGWCQPSKTKDTCDSPILAKLFLKWWFNSRWDSLVSCQLGFFCTGGTPLHIKETQNLLWSMEAPQNLRGDFKGWSGC